MPAHITALLNELSSATTKCSDADRIIALLRAISPELETLDAKNFPSEFAILRQKFLRWGKEHTFVFSEACPQIKKISDELAPILQQPAAMAAANRLAFMSDPKLKTIASRDYRELTEIALPHNAWKSAVVLAGSVLEAILFDRLEDPQHYSAAIASSKAPKKSGIVRDLKVGDWKLIDLINVAVDIKLLPSSRANLIDQALRDHRNYVHPKKEMMSQYSCTETEAKLAAAALEAVCDTLK